MKGVMLATRRTRFRLARQAIEIQQILPLELFASGRSRNLARNYDERLKRIGQ
jgi:hypothetical protein